MSAAKRRCLTPVAAIIRPLIQPTISTLHARRPPTRSLHPRSRIQGIVRRPAQPNNHASSSPAVDTARTIRNERFLGVSTYHLRFSLEPRLTGSAKNMLTMPFHPLHLAAVRKYRPQNRPPFTWDVIMTNHAGPKAVVRTTSVRRFRKILVQVLAESGFDAKGKVVPDKRQTTEDVVRRVLRGEDGGAQENGDTLPREEDGREEGGDTHNVRRDSRWSRDLEGSAFFILKPIMSTAHYDKIKPEVRMAVDRIIELQKGDSQGVLPARRPRRSKRSDLTDGERYEGSFC